MLYVRAATSDVACGNGDARIERRHRNLSKLAFFNTTHLLTFSRNFQPLTGSLQLYVDLEIPLPGDCAETECRRAQAVATAALERLGIPADV